MSRFPPVDNQAVEGGVVDPDPHPGNVEDQG